jgi:nucleotide-binding universal stress UspA family protein
MTAANTSGPVVAGIDGSATALHAALWAIDEAVLRGTVLRLVYVTKPDDRSAPEYAEDVRRGHESLHEARTAIEAMGMPVTVQTVIVDGPATEALIAQSAEAQMVCVGSTGIDGYARSIVGSTAGDLAEKAHCPVAVIRTELHPAAPQRWILVAVDDRPGNDAVVEHALREAELRQVPVLALGDDRGASPTETLEEKIRPWRASHPDVHIYPVAGDADVAHFLKRHDEPVVLAVIGADEAGDVAQIVGHGHSLFRHGAASALVVRP